MKLQRNTANVATLPARLRQPVQLFRSRFSRDTRLPWDWGERETELGGRRERETELERERETELGGKRERERDGSEVGA